MMSHPPTPRTNVVARPEMAVASARSEMPKKTPSSIAIEPLCMNSAALVLRLPISMFMTPVQNKQTGGERQGNDEYDAHAGIQQIFLQYTEIAE